MSENPRRPAFGIALATFLAFIAILMVGIFKFKVPVHVLLFIGIVLTALVAKASGFKWKEIETAMGSGVNRAMIGLFIFFLIGMTIGAWIQSGTVPALIYYGLKLLSPKWFLPAGLIICSATSLATGTSWGTVGTVGLALIGIGVGMGIPAPIVAGMILSGAFFGYNLSPLSAVTNLSAISVETGLYDHIRAMMVSSFPAYVIATVMFAFTGFKYAKGALNTEQVASIQQTIAAQFHISVWLFFPMVLVLVLSVMKVPAIPSTVSGIFGGIVISLVFQGASITSVLTTLFSGFKSTSGVEAVDKLLNRGGLMSMMDTFSLAFIALALGGVFDELHFLEVLVEKMTHRIKRTASLTTLTIVSALAGNAATGEAYLSIILNGRLYSRAFDKKNLKRQMLSRCLGEGSVYTVGMIPWTTAGAFTAGALSVPSLQYAPYAFLCWVAPLISIVFSYAGVFILRKAKTKVVV